MPRTGCRSVGDVIVATRDGSGNGTTVTADLGNPASLGDLVDRLRPAIVVNAAAHTAVDRAEGEPS